MERAIGRRAVTRRQSGVIGVGWGRGRGEAGTLSRAGPPPAPAAVVRLPQQPCNASACRWREPLADTLPRADGHARAVPGSNTPVPTGAGTCIPACRPSAHAPAACSPVARVPSRSSGRTPPAPPRWSVAPRTIRRRRPGHPTSARMDSPPLPPSFKRVPADACTCFCTFVPACRPATRALAAHSPRPARSVVPRLHRPASPSPSHTPPFPLRGTPPPCR